VQFGCTCRAIAQTKPTNSRAIAAVATLVSLPAQMSLRCRRHSRSCAFHAISRLIALLVRTQSGLNALLRDQFTVDVRPGLRSPIWARVSRARPIWGVPTLSCGAYSGVALNGSRPKSSGDRAYHERRLTTRDCVWRDVTAPQATALRRELAGVG